MCGIIGYIGKKRKIEESLIESLKTLEYRGYDSAGIAYVTNKVNIVKSSGKISKLEEKIDKNIESNLGIAHTRWATHGKATSTNAHPHKVGSVTLVHNGIIENYLELKKMLIDNGYKFKSDTDSEIAAALLDYLKQKDIWNNLEVIKEFETYIKGSYALAIIFDDELDALYAVKKDSPMVIGVGDTEKIVASDISAVIKHTREYIILDNGDIARITEDNFKIYNSNLKEQTKKIEQVSWNVEEAEKNGYPHFMLKEINEESNVLKDTIHEYIENIDSIIDKLPNFSKYNKIHIVACGSAMHAGLIGKYYFENMAGIETIVEVASEYRYKKVFYDERTLVILISQSGETADTIASLRKAKQDNIDTLAIVNVKTSTIAREAKHTMFIEAGPEIAVATTKAYLLQVAMFSLLALKAANIKGLENNYEEVIKEARRLPNLVKKVLNDHDKFEEVGKELLDAKDAFYIGRGIDFAICKEGSLKLKEVSYVHSDAYEAGELKHGTISLIEDNIPVFAVITNEKIKDKTESNVIEVESRQARVYTITNDGSITNHHYKYVVEKISDYFQPILVVPPLQLIGYYTANERNLDIDKPRNLAKSVTVE